MALSPKDRLSQIAFSDGHPVGLRYDGEALVLDYENWQEKMIRLRFTGVALFTCYGASASLCEAVVLEESPAINDARNKLAGDWGTHEAWRDKALTELQIVDDLPVLRVVFEDFELLTGS
jgi:hypothetical protein